MLEIFTELKNICVSIFPELLAAAISGLFSYYFGKWKERNKPFQEDINLFNNKFKTFIESESFKSFRNCYPTKNSFYYQDLKDFYNMIDNTSDSKGFISPKMEENRKELLIKTDNYIQFIISEYVPLNNNPGYYTLYANPNGSTTQEEMDDISGRILPELKKKHDLFTDEFNKFYSFARKHLNQSKVN